MFDEVTSVYQWFRYCSVMMMTIAQLISLVSVLFISECYGEKIC